MLTVAYFTNRRDCKWQWFADSLKRETKGIWDDIKLVVVDFSRGLPDRDKYIVEPDGCKRFVHVEPKPNVWQGKHRLTTQDYFAASNARNTAICHAEDGWIAFVDDLSVLMPGWLSRVRLAQNEGYIALGAYKKVKDLVVEKGDVKSFTPHPPGVDSRWGYGADTNAVPCSGSWMFGCSVAAPVEALLTINGFDEDCDSLGSEDYIAGIMMERNGFTFRYDRQMLTLESEEDHFKEQPFKRTDKGFSPNDKSHAILNMVREGRGYAPNYFGEGGIRALRKRILAGDPFPIQQIPQHDWFDGQPISEF